MKKKVIVLTDGLIPNAIQNWLEKRQNDLFAKIDSYPIRMNFMHREFAEARSNPELIRFIEDNAVKGTKKQKTEFITSTGLKRIEKEPNEIIKFRNTQTINPNENYGYYSYYSWSDETALGATAEFRIIELDTSAKWELKRNILEDGSCCEIIVKYKELRLINQELNLYCDTNDFFLYTPYTQNQHS